MHYLFFPIPYLRKWQHHFPRLLSEHYHRLPLTFYIGSEASPVELHHLDTPGISVPSLTSIALDASEVQGRSSPMSTTAVACQLVPCR